MYLNVNRHPQQGPHNEQENLMIDESGILII